MATQFAERIMILAGTRDGLHLYESDQARERWSSRGPYLEGKDVSHAVLDPRDGKTIWAAVNGDGEAAVYRSADRGISWQRAGKPFDAVQVWHVEPALANRPDSVYAGTDPSNLYCSDNRGDDWYSVPGFANHPSRDEWYPGGGGMCLHTILTNPQRPDDLIVAMSVGGMFYSSDGGDSWEPRNEGVTSLAEMWSSESGRPALHPVHRCTHKIVRHPDNGLLFQQNHVGVYRSEDYGQNWIDISDGLPDRFGFVIDVTRDGTVYVVPQHDWLEDVGVRISGQLAVYRSRDKGTTWDRLVDGLPEVEHMTLYREGLATDFCDVAGIYFGTSDGRLLFSRDSGDHWDHIAQNLPAVRSISCEHFSDRAM